MSTPERKTTTFEAADRTAQPNSGAFPRSAPDERQILVTPVGLQMPEVLSFETWERAGDRLAAVMKSSVWCVGDWIEHGERQFTDRYRRVIDQVGLEYQTVRNYAWVARRFPLERRRTSLSFQHHAEVARLPDAQQDHWLDQAEEMNWSRNELRSRLRDARSGRLTQQGTITLPRIAAEQERLQRWQAAAAQSTESFEQWVVQSLDNAAAAALNRIPPDESD